MAGNCHWMKMIRMWNSTNGISRRMNAWKLRTNFMFERLIHVAEPKLQFRFNQKVDYPRDGLYLFGPVDAGTQPRQVRYGFIGTPGSLRRFEEWAFRVSSFIDVPERGRMSKAVEAQHVAFPGFNEAFFANWPTKPARTIIDIDERDLLDAMRITNRYEAIKSTVDVFV